MHETGDLTCPRCGESIMGVSGSVDMDVAGSGGEKQIRTHVQCPECDALVDIVIESALPDGIGVDVYVEDGHRKARRVRRDDDVEGGE